MDVPETRYARGGGYHIAYQTLGEGPPDIVPLSSWFSNVEADWDLPPLAAYLRRIPSLGRLIHFDKRGTGLSDPVTLQTLPTLEEWMDDPPCGARRGGVRAGDDPRVGRERADGDALRIHLSGAH